MSASAEMRCMVATCIECLQNALFPQNVHLIQIISSSQLQQLQRISYFQGTDLSAAFPDALASLRETNPGSNSEIVIRVSHAMKSQND